jgi:hypothetical protein
MNIELKKKRTKILTVKIQFRIAKTRTTTLKAIEALLLSFEFAT